jgi:membrane fusion protein, multidrug efflux system
LRGFPLSIPNFLDRTERFGIANTIFACYEQEKTEPFSSLLGKPPMSNAAVVKIQSEAPHQAAAKPPSAAPQPPAKPKASPVRRVFMGLVLVAALSTAAYYGYDYWTVGRFAVSTDDAYVKADMSILGAKIPGYVDSVPFADNAAVKSGDVVLKLDDGDYKLAVDAAKAKIETQKASIEAIAKQKIAQVSAVVAAQAQLESAKAAEINAVLTQNRASQLVKSNAGSQQALDDANHARATASANVNAAQANIDAANAQLAIFDAQTTTAQRLMDELNIALAKAERDLGFTEIKAPFDGVVANRAVEPGQFVGAGSRLLALVPTQLSFVTANFKETQIASIHAGAKAEITIDAYKGEKFEGKVDSISPASGAEFSLLPPDNATGNFTKITQRVPVKISVPPEVAAKLRPGMSATVTIDARDTGAN